MKHLFKLIILFPWFYFFSWIEKANRNSKFFPIFYYFYWFYFPIFALLGIFMAVVSIFFITILLKNGQISGLGVSGYYFYLSLLPVIG